MLPEPQRLTSVLGMDLTFFYIKERVNIYTNKWSGLSKKQIRVVHVFTSLHQSIVMHEDFNLVYHFTWNCYFVTIGISLIKYHYLSQV